jgi:cytochrome P450
MLPGLAAVRDPDTGQPLTIQELRDQVLVFLAAGHETTASALAFTLHQLGRHPRIQDRVAGGGDELTRAALLEGMRLFPPAYLFPRLAIEETEVGGCRLPAGTGVLVSPWVTHRHPALWRDPDRFDPERFVGGTDRPRYAYFPFGGGPHACIGEHFALLEAAVLLRTILSRYRVEALDSEPPVAAQVVLRPAAPVRARLTRR